LIRKRKSNCKFLLATLVSAISIFGLNQFDRNIKAADSVTVEPVTTTVSTNMLNVDTAIVTKAEVKNMIGKDQQISVKFTGLPENENLFAVLVDEVAGGVIESKFLDKNDSVTFSNIKEFIKIPGIHLYKQNANDPDFVLRKENFVASTSYLMPYVKKLVDNGGLGENSNKMKAYKGNGALYDQVPEGVLYTTTIPQVYSFAIPANTLPFIDGAADLDAGDILAAVIAEDESGKTLDVRQWVSTNYNEKTGTNKNLCRFEFLLPQGTKNVQIHLYKYGLFEENFLCKYIGNINKKTATNYTIYPTS
jgi:tartrate dehydratase beta subunit/fumarate hydratase class I family protein